MENCRVFSLYLAAEQLFPLYRCPLSQNPVFAVDLARARSATIARWGLSFWYYLWLVFFGRYEKAVKASRAKKEEAVEQAEKLREVIHSMDAYWMSQPAIECCCNSHSARFKWSHRVMFCEIVLCVDVEPVEHGWCW